MSAVYDFQNTARRRAACEQGASFRRKLTLKTDDGDRVDLTGYLARMQVRSSLEATAVIVELTSANGRIEIDGADGEILLKLTAAETAALPSGAYLYDLELVSSSDPDDVQRLIEGRFVVSRNVTR